jgi:hypothetical protein
VICDIVVQDVGAKGKGVCARRRFSEGEFIFRRKHGRAVTAEDLLTLSDEERMLLCETGFDTWKVVLPPGCYLNHSCEPNAMRSGVKVFAWRDIAPGEEITIDYRLNAFQGERSECLCGSTSCPGEVIWSFFALDEDRQRLYLPYAADFIRREWRRRGPWGDHLSGHDTVIGTMVGTLSTEVPSRKQGS